LSNIKTKSLQIRAKKTPNILDLKNIRPTFLTSKMAPTVCRKTHEGLFLQVTPKNGLHDFCGRGFAAKISNKKLFGQVCGNSSKNPSHPPKLALSYAYAPYHLASALYTAHL